MPIRKIEPKVHKTVDTWVINNLNQLIAGVGPGKCSKPITVDREFSSEFRGQVSTWKVQLSIVDSRSLFELRILFMPINGVHNVTCNFYLVDIDENHRFIGRNNQRANFDNIQKDCCHLYKYLYSSSTKEELFPNDTMTLRMELLTYVDDNPTFPFLDLVTTKNLNVNLPNDFLKLYNSRQSSGDVIIQVQNIKFPVHRCVLETRCPALYKEVGHYQQTSGSSNSIVLTLTDIHPKIFERVLEYIYTGKVNDLDDHSEYLLEAAHKYKLKNLKGMCEMSLIANYLNFESSSEVLDLATRCNTRGLQYAAETVLKTKASIVVSSDTSPHFDFAFDGAWTAGYRIKSRNNY